MAAFPQVDARIGGISPDLPRPNVHILWITLGRATASSTDAVHRPVDNVPPVAAGTVARGNEIRR